MELTSSYDWLLVTISVAAAMLSSFVALSVVPRIYSTIESSRSMLWVGAFGMSIGTGIWTMHFLGMLAFHLPVPVQYDLNLTIFSLLLAIGVCAIAILPLRSGGSMKAFKGSTLFMGVMMGLGVAGMHYTGMAAMRLDATMQHENSIVALAIAIAIVASTAALLIANQLRDTRVFSQLPIKIAASLVMGIAVSAMHYTAMAGMRFHAIEGHISYSEVIDPHLLAIFVLIVAFLVQGGLIITAILDEAYGAARASEAMMKRRAEMNHALSEILAAAVKKRDLKATLQQVLEIILDVKLLALQKQGCIFLSDEKKQTLHMLVEHNMAGELCQKCNEVAFGNCLCGKAAKSGRILFKSSVDDDHQISFDQMPDHGHFCVPVKSGKKLLALINLYVSPGHEPKQDAFQFLSTVADAVASIIESRLIEARANKISAAIDQAGEAVQITDANGTIEYVNQAFCSNSGYSETELIGAKPSILKSGKQDDPFYQQMWKTILAGEVWQGELIERRKDGSHYPAMLTISPIRNEQNEITHYVGIHEDLSEHKKLESQFRQAQKMESLGTLVGGIAHEFNNMLASMIGNLFLLKKQVRDIPDASKKVERIEKVSFDAASMIKQMLIFAKNEDVEMSVLSFSKFVKEAFALHQIAIPENISVHTDFCTQPLYITGNTTQLQQVVLNLFGNAVDAVKESDKPTIEIRIQPFDSTESFLSRHPEAIQNQYVHMEIRDNGHGVNENDMENIFDPFFSTKEVGEGTGLGLSTSASIIRSHKGFIDAESSPGKGTSMHIYLPMIESQLAEEMLDKADRSIDMQAFGASVLIADDDENVRLSTAEALESIGYMVSTAANGRDAIDQYSAGSFDVVILDVVMPELGGADAAREILAADHKANIIFATGYDREQALEGAGDLTKIPVLSKPFEITELQQTIRMLID